MCQRSAVLETDRIEEFAPIKNATGNDSPIPAVVSPGRTVSVDLSGSPDERMASYEKETRYEIRRAYRRGLEQLFADGGKR